MARAIWSGAINFGLVSVPVGLYSATEDHTIHFHQYERGTSDRVRNQRVNERTGKEVEYENVVKGREVRGGDLVLIEQDELDDIAPGRSRTIDINGFVDLEQIDPIFFQKTYYLAPAGDEYGRTYDLLRQALERSGRAGIALFVMRGKQYLTALRATGKVLALETLYFADEVRDPAQELDSLPKRRKFAGKELDTAIQLIEAMSMDFEPAAYKDTYTEQVEKLIRAKRRGKKVVPAEEPREATNVVDLMDALQQSIQGSKGSRGSGGSRRSKGSKNAKSSRASTSGGRGRSSSDLSGLNKKQLYERAGSLGVAGRSKMSRDELETAVRKAS